MQDNFEKLEVVYCSFCGKPDTEVEVMVKGEAGIAICNNCVDIARDVVGYYRSRGHNNE